MSRWRLLRAAPAPQPGVGVEVDEYDLRAQNEWFRDQLGECQSRVAAALRRAEEYRVQLAEARADHAALAASRTPPSASRRTFMEKEIAELRRNLRDMEARARRAEHADPTIRQGG